MCDCIKLMNEALAEHNAKLDTALQFNEKTLQFEPLKVQIRIYKADPKKRKPLPALLARYCPFCGEPYEKRGSAFIFRDSSSEELVRFNTDQADRLQAAAAKLADRMTPEEIGWTMISWLEKLAE